MFDKNFYPTPEHVLDDMLRREDVRGKTILEPQSGKADIVKRLFEEGAREVLGCEIHPDLYLISSEHCTRMIGQDFLQVTSDQISHIDMIVMNPPFDKGGWHLLHAWKIAPPNCKIICLLNYETLNNPGTQARKELLAIVNEHGSFMSLGDCFDEAERTTNVEVALVKMTKPHVADYEQEFAGFFEEEELEEKQVNGIMSYNAVRDLVNRYVTAVKIFDEQLETAVRLNTVMGDYFEDTDQEEKYNDRTTMSVTVAEKGVPVKRSEFKKRLQKSGWRWIFKKMNIEKYSTKKLKEDINKFVEQQQNIPFTMRNIYQMLEIVVATTGQRMDKALTEIFDRMAGHSYNEEWGGFKTNSEMLLPKKFIIPQYSIGEIDELLKVLCWISGREYNDFIDFNAAVNYSFFILNKNTGKFVLDPSYDFPVHYKWHRGDIEKGPSHYRYPKELLEANPHYHLHEINTEYGGLFEWAFFKVRRYKKGTVHFEFTDEDVWALFNQNLARIKGYVIPVKKEKTKYQKRQTFEKPVETMV